MQALKLSRERYADWNNIVDALKPIVESVWLTHIIHTIPINNSISMENDLKWDIIGVLMEIEYSDISKVELYRTQFI